MKRTAGFLILLVLIVSAGCGKKEETVSPLFSYNGKIYYDPGHVNIVFGDFSGPVTVQDPGVSAGVPDTENTDAGKTQIGSTGTASKNTGASFRNYTKTARSSGTSAAAELSDVQELSGVWQGSDQNQTMIVLRNDLSLFYTEIGSSKPEIVRGSEGSWNFDRASGKLTMYVSISGKNYVLSGEPSDGSMILRCDNGQAWNDEVVSKTTLTENDVYEKCGAQGSASYSGSLQNGQTGNSALYSAGYGSADYVYVDIDAGTNEILKTYYITTVNASAGAYRVEPVGGGDPVEVSYGSAKQIIDSAMTDSRSALPAEGGRSLIIWDSPYGLCAYDHIYTDYQDLPDYSSLKYIYDNNVLLSLKSWIETSTDARVPKSARQE